MGGGFVLRLYDFHFLLTSDDLEGTFRRKSSRPVETRSGGISVSTGGETLLKISALMEGQYMEKHGDLHHNE